MSRINENDYTGHGDRETNNYENKEEVQQPGKRRRKKLVDLRSGMPSAVKNTLEGENEIKRAIQQSTRDKRKKDGVKDIGLYDIISLITELPVILRNKVLQECDWQESTYYNRFRAEISPSFAEQSMVKTVSHAELVTILKIYVEELGLKLDVLKSMQLKVNNSTP